MIKTFTTWPNDEIFDHHVNFFEPFRVIKASSSRYPSAENLAALSCEVDVCSTEETGNQRNIFYGDVLRQEHLSMKLSSFAEGFLATKNEQCHWIDNVGLHLYLSQSTIYSEDPAVTPFQIVGLRQEVEIPLPLERGGYQISQINLWMNISTVFSALHYDAYDNILVLLQGRKVVTLVSPRYTNSTRAAYLVAGGGANHSLASSVDDLVTAGLIPASDTLTIVLMPGDALFIPEGWWHDVASDMCSMALNFWFRSPIQGLLNCSNDKILRSSDTINLDINNHSNHMASYLLRASLQTLVVARLKDIYESYLCSISNLRYDLNTMNEELFASFMLDLHRLSNISDANGISGSMSVVDCENGTGVEGYQYEKDDVEKSLVTCSYQTMTRLWPDYVDKHPDVWGDILMALSPTAAHVLTSFWNTLDTRIVSKENAENSPEVIMEVKLFFSRIFHPLGDRAAKIRLHLIVQSDELARQSCVHIFKDVLGLNMSDFEQCTGSL